MKKMLFLIIFIINFCDAGERQRQIQQTFLPPCLPSITSDLLAVHAQLAPQTHSQHETYEQEVARLKTQYKEKDQEVTQLMARIRSLEQALQNKETEHAAELEKLTESLHRVTYVSRNQKAKIEEQEHLLEIATREIVEHQKNDDERNRQIAVIISYGRKTIEEMRQRQRANGLTD